VRICLSVDFYFKYSILTQEGRKPWHLNTETIAMSANSASVHQKEATCAHPPTESMGATESFALCGAHKRTSAITIDSTKIL
jgi:hypothetical protein